MRKNCRSLKLVTFFALRHCNVGSLLGQGLAKKQRKSEKPSRLTVRNLAKYAS
ncbi:hypothetical protein OEV75_11030 [Caldibacillus kokeshiiformis]|nr:hypothetical protein [Pallidibacillus thermolactis subsp. kokeshiiformis]